MYDTASSRWTELDGERQGLIRRCESYAMFTIPKLCLPQGYNQNNDELQHDYQAVGAQCVNHLSNKLMLALFAPSRPFFRLDPSEVLQKQLAEMKISEDELAALLSVAEHKAVKILDQRSIRPKLYDVTKHLIVTGNCLKILDSATKGTKRGAKGMRVLGIKNYCVKRDADGDVMEIVTKEQVPAKALAEDIRVYMGGRLVTTGHDDKVEMYRWIRRRPDGDYEMTLWVNDVCIMMNKYMGKWTAEKLPYRAVTWDLASGDDYGTGLVEDYAGDFASLSILSKSTIQAAVLASEFRWLVNPAGMTSVDDFEKSANGAAIPGQQGDITLLASGTGAVLQSNIAIASEYINRIGRGFLLASAVTRKAERVTAEEIRMTAEELETGLGGAYSRVAVDVQVPLAYWLMEQAGSPIKGTDVQPTIITGLAALSRSGDRDNLVLFLQDCTMLGSLPPQIAGRLNIDVITAQFAAARGLVAAQYVKPEAQFKQEQAQEQERAIALANAQAQGQAQAEAQAAAATQG